MKKSLAIFIIAIFAAAAAGANVISTTCVADEFNSANTALNRMKCRVDTDDAGSMYVVVTSATVTMRIAGDGTLNAGDIPNIKTAVQTAYRAAVVAARADEAARAAEFLRRSKSTMPMTRLETE